VTAIADGAGDPASSFQRKETEINQDSQMFKHLSKLFDYEELAGLMNECEQLQAGGQNAEATELRESLANFLTNAELTQSARH